MSKKAAILITESPRAVLESEPSGYDAFYVYDMTFIPVVANGELRCNLKENDVFKSILTDYENLKKEGCETDILIGFDMDDAGELMSHAMLACLLEHDIPYENIIRMPFCENGFVVFSDFVDISDYIKYRDIQNSFMEKLRKEGVSPLGIRKAYALDFMEKFKRNKGADIKVEKAKSINPQGTSTYTYVTRYLLKWEDENTVIVEEEEEENAKG